MTDDTSLDVIPDFRDHYSVAQDIAAARNHRLFRKLRPLAHVLITTRPHRRLSRIRQTAGGIIKPDFNQGRDPEYGLAASIVAAGPCDEDFTPGDVVILPQFAGTIIYDLVEGAEASDLWLVYEGDVLCRLVLDDDES